MTSDFKLAALMQLYFYTECQHFIFMSVQDFRRVEFETPKGALQTCIFAKLLFEPSHIFYICSTRERLLLLEQRASSK